MSTTITFDQMERSADRTLAVALWARHVHSILSCIPSFAILHVLLRGLLRSVSADDRLSRLTEEQSIELAGRLRELHGQMMYVLDHRGMQILKTRPVFSSLIAVLEEDTEDLYDIVENIALASNDQFRRLVSDCVQHVVSVEQPETVGRV